MTGVGGPVRGPPHRYPDGDVTGDRIALGVESSYRSDLDLDLEPVLNSLCLSMSCSKRLET